MPKELRAQYGDASSAPADDYVLVSKADEDLPDGPCRGLLVGSAGSANLQTADGGTRTNVPLQQGYNPLICKQVRTGGTASDIWALY